MMRSLGWACILRGVWVAGFCMRNEPMHADIETSIAFLRYQSIKDLVRGWRKSHAHRANTF